MISFKHHRIDFRKGAATMEYGIKVLVEETLEKGLLDDFSGGDYHVGSMLRSIMLLRQGALLPGTIELRNVPKWRHQEIALMKGLVKEEILLNACAEEYHHAFDKKEELFNGLLWGVLLGPEMVKVYNYYETSSEFYACVVGINYEDRWKNLKTLKRGEGVFLIREPFNEYDPNAIRVLTGNGKDLGFLRRTLAKSLAPRIDADKIELSGSIAALYTREDEACHWLYIKLNVLGLTI
jgi:hypothetical protein